MRLKEEPTRYDIYKVVCFININIEFSKYKICTN